MATEGKNAGPNVLVSGVLLGQPMGGVRRHNTELLPRASRLLNGSGGRLFILEGTQPVGFQLPSTIGRIPTRVPPNPRWLRGIMEGRSIRHSIKKSDTVFDLVHFGHLPVPRRLPLPYTLTLHDLRSIELAPVWGLSRLLAYQIHKQAVERAAFVITVSETVATNVVERFHLDPKKVRLVPNAADHLEPLPRNPGKDAPILHIGHVEPHKNLELLVRALSIDRDLPPLCLAGAPKQNEDERLRNLAAELGVEKRMTFLNGFDESELPSLYASAACVVLPSRLEGFGIVALEAQRAGVPLCVSGAGALSEVAGTRVPHFSPDDPTDCARAIQAALSAPAASLEMDRREAMRFSWDRSARTLFGVWEETARSHLT